MKANVLNKDGKNTTLEMGSYGIGVSRLVAAIIEAKCQNGIMKWPKEVSPFDIAVIPLNSKNESKPIEIAEKMYFELQKKGFDVIMDDTNDSPSSKFKNFDLIGAPYQLIIGNKTSEDKFEFKEVNSKTEFCSFQQVLQKLNKK